LDTQGHASFAWTMLGAVAQATKRVELMSYVTCPMVRYHPAVVAQKAATLQLLAEGRFTLGLESGERLNEHIVGQGWPGGEQRQERLVEIIRELHTGHQITYDGKHFQVDSARYGICPTTSRARCGRRRAQGDRPVRRAGPAPHRRRAGR